jgi:nucleoside-diphosphate-sugar epimerase
MNTALVIGGTRFIGRHLVEALLDAGYGVTLYNRGTHENPFADREGVTSVTGDRDDEATLREAATVVSPDAVFDTVAYHPDQVDTATDVFADCEAYIYVSSASAYAEDRIPHREGESPLHECTEAQATDDSPESYGPRKAAGDRAVFAAAEAGVRAMSVRPVLVYGPHDYTERFDYWVDRVRRFDRVVVPADGDSLLHRVYVEDVANALVTIAENGTAGEAYNVADRRLVTLAESVDRAAAAADVEVDIVAAGRETLAAAGVDPTEFPLYVPYPFVVDTEKLAALGWSSTSLPTAYDRTVTDHAASDRNGRENGPDRDAEMQVLDALDRG